MTVWGDYYQADTRAIIAILYYCNINYRLQKIEQDIDEDLPRVIGGQLDAPTKKLSVVITNQEALLTYLQLSKPLKTKSLSFETSEYTMWLK